MLRYSRRLPITKFFAYSSALIAVLAVVLAGKGVAALQEAGMIDIRPLSNFPRISMLGIFPSTQVLGAQLLTVAGWRSASGTIDGKLRRRLLQARRRSSSSAVVDR